MSEHTGESVGADGGGAAGPAPGRRARWGSLAELETATVAYRPSWWRNHADAIEVLTSGRLPGRLGQVSARAADGIVTTHDVFADTGSGTYLPIRAALHETIVADCLTVSEPDAGTDGATGRRPRVFFTIGAPGAGKTSILRQIVDTYCERGPVEGTDAVTPAASVTPAAPVTPATPVTPAAQARPTRAYSVVDADRVREALPEFADGLGSLVVQQEAFDVTYEQVLPAAVRRRDDIVFDTIGRPSSLASSLTRLQDEGYELHVLHATCPRSVCQSRTADRALVNGRLVDPTVLDFDQAISDARAVLNDLVASKRLDGWLDVDTTDPDQPLRVDGTQPWTETFDRWSASRAPEPHLEVNP